MMYAMVVMLNVNISDMATITLKNVGYRSNINNISQNKTINLLKNSVIEDRRYL